MKWKISAVTTDITESTTLTAEQKYGGWLAINQGTASATVMGYELQPGEGLDFRDIVPPGSWWDSAIQIRINPGAIVRVTRLQYMQVA